MAGNRERAAVSFFLMVIAVDFCCVRAFESCQTLGTEIVVTKEKTQDLEGRPVRLLCVGTVNTKKCEGTCMSQVSPSVVKFPGFLKVRNTSYIANRLICTTPHFLDPGCPLFCESALWSGFSYNRFTVDKK